MRHSIRSLLLIAGTAALSRTVVAQRPATADTTPIPRALANALVGSGMWGVGPIIIGRVPEGFPVDALPQNVVVLGGTGWAGGARVVIALPPSVTNVLDWADTVTARVGWRSPPTPFRMPTAGFIAFQERERFAHYCRGRDVLRVIPGTGLTGEPLASLIFESSTRNAGCDRDPQADARMNAFSAEYADLPRIQLPRGVAISRGGGGWNGNDEARETSARVAASGPPAELLDVLARQLRDSGWTLGVPLANRTIALVQAEKREADGRSRFAVLSVLVVPGSGERDLTLRVSRVPESR